MHPISIFIQQRFFIQDYILFQKENERKFKKKWKKKLNQASIIVRAKKQIRQARTRAIRITETAARTTAAPAREAGRPLRTSSI